jgi:hypothetical protein
MTLDGAIAHFERTSSRSKKKETWDRDFGTPAAAAKEVKELVRGHKEIGYTVEGETSDAEPEAPKLSKPRAFTRPAWWGKLSEPLERQRKKIQNLLKKAGLAHRADEIEALAKPSITFSVKKAKRAPDGVASRLGGDPDLAGAWPKHGKRPLHFIGQIVLSDVKPFDLEGVLPAAKGHLAFFAQLDEQRDDYAAIGSVVHVTGASERTESPVPSQLEAIGLLTPKPLLTLPYYEDPAIMKLKLTDDERSTYHDEVFLALLPDESPHLLLGYGTSGTEHSLEGRTFLAQFSADDRVGFGEGDDQTLRFYFKGKGEQRSLGAVACTLEEA